jgi:hypothetical protein
MLTESGILGDVRKASPSYLTDSGRIAWKFTPSGYRPTVILTEILTVVPLCRPTALSAVPELHDLDLTC